MFDYIVVGCVELELVYLVGVVYFGVELDCVVFVFVEFCVVVVCD